MITWAGCFFFFFLSLGVPFSQFLSTPPTLPPPPFSFYLLPSTTIHCSLCLVSFILREWCRNLFHSLSYLPDALQFGLKFFRLRFFFPSTPFAEKCSSWIISPTRETLWRIAEHSKSPPKRSSEWEACSSGRFHRWRRVLATATVPAARKPINTSIITRLRQQRLSSRSRRRHRRRPTRIKLAIRGLI